MVVLAETLGEVLERTLMVAAVVVMAHRSVEVVVVEAALVLPLVVVVEATEVVLRGTNESS